MGIHVIDNRLFGLHTKNMSYVFGIDPMGLVRHLYFGNLVSSTEDFEMREIFEISTNDPVLEITPEEFPVYGGLRYKEHCLKATFHDGCREIVYEYVGHHVDHQTLVVTLKDQVYDFEFDLTYVLYEEENLIERFVTLRNTGRHDILIEQIQSAQLHIPAQNLMFTNTHGYWGAELQPARQRVGYGKIKFENRRGISTHNHNPFFMLDENATETTGDVYFGVLKLTGNFSGTVEQTQYGETLVQMGINSHDFNWNLKAGESFKTPALLFGYTPHGFETVTHTLNHYANKHVLREGLRPILFNSWEATEFEVTCDEQIKLAKKASELGAELFVVDDGWFGRRNSIHDGLGDWQVNPEKFPQGLGVLIEEVKQLGMRFGIWVEPEMVNPNSDLYHAHPEWIYQFESRQSDTSRGQYVLNLSKPEVKQFVYEMLDELLSSHDIDYIKWDANRPISQSSTDQSIWVKHIHAVYDIVTMLKQKHPHVLFEACASGGGRVDYGILGIFDDFWTSDNTDAYDRLLIQSMYSTVYPIKAMRAWVTDCPNFLSHRHIPLAFRYHSAMLGTLGIGCNILKFTEEETTLSQDMIQTYKAIRPIVQDGRFYRLKPISTNEYHAFGYVKGHEALAFVFLPQSKLGHTPARLKMRGLDANKTYTYELDNEVLTKTGAYLMQHGITLRLTGDYDSVLIQFKSN